MIGRAIRLITCLAVAHLLCVVLNGLSWSELIYRLWLQSAAIGLFVFISRFETNSKN